MFSENIRIIYRRFLILGLLLMCLFVFGYSDKIGTVLADTGICMQDCAKYEEMCLDLCQYECDTGSRDTDCNSCISSCFTQSNNCYEHSIYCQNGTINYDPQCTVQYNMHCLGSWLDTPNCDLNNGAHYNYYEICNRIGYANGCIVCPNNETCCHDSESCGNGNPNGIPQCLDN